MTEPGFTLAKELEVGCGHSKALDRKIARLAGWHRVEPRLAKTRHGAWISPDDFLGVYSTGEPILDSLHGTEMHREVPPYTASLDAVCMLISRLSPGAEWELTNLYGVSRAGVGLNSPSPAYGSCEAGDEPSRSARALAAALLRHIPPTTERSQENG